MRPVHPDNQSVFAKRIVTIDEAFLFSTNHLETDLL